MPSAYAAYKVLSSGLFALLLPTAGAGLMASKKHRKGFAQRLGIYPKPLTVREDGASRIWLHAASVGEVGVAVSILTALKRSVPSCDVILSTTTVHGRSLAETATRGLATCVFAPVDFLGSVRLALSTIRPEIMVWVETELWPNWIVQAKRMGIRTAVVNGRISPRSMNRYRRIEGLFAETLPFMDAFSMIGDGDASRIRNMGAPANRVAVNGNAKYDLLVKKTGDRLQRETADGLYLDRKRPILVAGSTRTGEEGILLNAAKRLRKQFPDLLLVIAPRHILRARGVARMAREQGHSCQLRSTWAPEHAKTTEVMVLDTYGELFGIYGLATVSFCGGSLVPKGGQNPMEAAAWGCPVLFGESMEDFQEARDLLVTAGGGVTVAGEEDLATRAAALLSSPQQLKEAGATARLSVENHSGAAGRHASVICKLLGESGGAVGS